MANISLTRVFLAAQHVTQHQVPPSRHAVVPPCHHVAADECQHPDEHERSQYGSPLHEEEEEARGRSRGGGGGGAGHRVGKTIQAPQKNYFCFQ